MASIKFRYETVGGRRVLQALNGLRRANTQTARSAQRDSSSTRRTVERDTRAEVRTETRGAQAGAREVVKAERVKLKAIRLTDRERSTNHRNELRRRRVVRRNERQQRARGRLGGLLRAGGAAVLGAAAGGGRAALGVTRGLQGTFGIRSQQDIIGSMVDSRQGFIRGMYQGGVRGDIQPHVNRVAGIATRTGVGPEEIMAAISESQTRFNTVGRANAAGPDGLDQMFEQFEHFARVSRATGSSLEDVQGAALAIERQFGLSGPEVTAALDLLVDGAARGSLSLGDFATAMPQAIATFRAARGTSGMEAVAEFSALGQQLASTELDARVARTAQQQILGQLADPSVQRKLRQRGVNVRDDEGNVRDIGSIISEIARNDRLDTLSEFQTVFSRESAQGIAALAQLEREGGTTLSARTAAANSGAGAEMVQTILDGLDADPSGEVIRQRIQRETNLVRESDRLIERFAEMTRVLTEMEDANPFVNTVGMPIAEGALQGAGIAAMMRMFSGGGGAAAGGGALTGLMGAPGTGIGAGTAFGSIGLLSGAAAVAAGTAIAAAFVAGISATGWFSSDQHGSLLDQVGDVLTGGDMTSAALGGGFWDSVVNAFTGGSGRADPEAGLRRQRESARERANAVTRAGTQNWIELGPQTIAALRVTEPGAGRRGEGAPGE